MLATMNPLGYPIKQNEIQSVLEPNDQASESVSRHVCYFFHCQREQLTKGILDRYVKACEVMQHVGFGTADEVLSAQLIEPIASAKRCYSLGETLACIELCALQGEMIAIYLCIVNKTNFYSEKIRENSDDKFNKSNNQKLNTQLGYNELNQKKRIALLVEGKFIDHEEQEHFIAVHERRISYFHHWREKIDDLDEPALESLKSISFVTRKHLELNDNKENIKKIKQYLLNSNS